MPQGEGDDRHGDFNDKVKTVGTHLGRTGQTKVQGYKCLYTNAQSMGNKKEELELLLQTEGYDIVGITETWWDDSHDWNVLVDGYELFKKNRKGRRGGGVALYVRRGLDCQEVMENGADSPVERI